MLITNNLAKLRGGIRQSEVAVAAGVSQGIYSMAETGQAVLPWEALWKLCAYYDVVPERVYHDWVLREVYNLETQEKPKKPKLTATVKIPIAIAEEVDRLIANGQYISRADFIVTAVRSALHE